GCRKNSGRPARLQSFHRRALRSACLRMEERRVLLEISPPDADLGSLSRQDRSNFSGNLVGLGATYGDHLLASLPVAVPALQHSAHLLGAASHFHDESIRRKD